MPTKKFRLGPFPRKLPIRVFLRNLFFLAVPNVALFLPLSMNRSSAIFNDRSFPGYFRSGGMGGQRAAQRVVAVAMRRSTATDINEKVSKRCESTHH
ncbi:MAG: hypothetical protein DWI00_02805 [Planctomycetota bacterium]|nr:MAG: hypothetical protein DWI00_02805 [Planctomycetota bacterium]